MLEVDDLYRHLLDLPRSKYSDLIRRVDAERRQSVEQEERDHPPPSAMSRDEFAHWIGRSHFAIDKGISQILYLPTGAPPEEVRLLEVNELVHIPENAPVEGLDFMPDIAGIDYRLFVADVTPRQFQAIQEGALALPAGWSLERSQLIPASN